MTNKEKTKEEKLDKVIDVTKLLDEGRKCIDDFYVVLGKTLEDTNELVNTKLKKAQDQEQWAFSPLEAFRREIESVNYELRVLNGKLIDYSLSLKNISALYVRTATKNLDKTKE